MRDPQLLRAVGQVLVVAEVARQPHVPEHRLLQLRAQRVVLVVHAHARELVVDRPVRRLHPEHARVVPLQHPHELPQLQRRRQLQLPPRLDHRDRIRVELLHADGDAPRTTAQNRFVSVY